MAAGSSRFSNPRVWRWWLLVLAVAGGLPVHAAEAAGARLHGGAAALWLVGPAAEAGETVVHVGPFPGPDAGGGDGGPTLLRRVASLNGRVTLAAPVEGGRSLYVVMRGGGVQRLLTRPAGEGVSFMPGPDLPAGLTPRAAAAVGRALWVLADADEEAAPEAAETAEEPAPRVEAGPDRPRSRLARRPSVEAGPPPAAPEPPLSGGPVLLELDRRGWVRHAAPAGLGSCHSIELLPPAAAGGTPSLLERTEAGRLRLHGPSAGGGWVVRELGAAPPLAGPPGRVGGVAVVGLADEDGLRVEALRPDANPPRLPLRAAGEPPFVEEAAVGIVPATDRLWLAVPTDDAPGGSPADADLPAWARFAAEPAPERGLRLTPVGLDGRVGPPRAVGVTDRARAPGVADFPLLLLVLMVATAATFVFWRRDPRRQRLRLSDRQRLAGLGPRVAAGLIDVGPGLLAAWWLLGAEPAEVFAHWPGLGRPSTPAEVLPPLVLIAVVVLHTGVAEVLTGRSMGKALLRLRVAGLDGKPASRGRLAGRALLKPVDLLAVLLLVLPLINPHRQRLTDLVAGTVVLGPEEHDDR